MTARGEVDTYSKSIQLRHFDSTVGLVRLETCFDNNMLVPRFHAASVDCHLVQVPTPSALYIREISSSSRRGLFTREDEGQDFFVAVIMIWLVQFFLQNFDPVIRCCRSLFGRLRRLLVIYEADISYNPMSLEDGTVCSDILPRSMIRPASVLVSVFTLAASKPIA